jgi:hypothetical protein
MQPEFIPFDSDEDLPNKRHRLSKDEQIYGIFYEPTHKIPKKKEEKPDKALNEVQLEQTYGKGFAMLQKHGYKVGEGLGKNSQGTTEILGIHLRRKNEGLSYSKPEQPVNINKPPPLLKDSHLKHQRHSHAKQPHAKLPVVLTKIEDKQTHVMQTMENNLVSLEFEEEQIIQNLSELDTKASELTEVLALLDNCSEDWQGAFTKFKAIKLGHFGVYHELYIHESFVVPIARSVFQELWAEWDFEATPLRGLSQLSQYLELGEPTDVSDLWLSTLKSYFSQKWDPKLEFGDSIDALNTWKVLLPEDAILLCPTILSSLHKAIDFWDPSSDRISVHTWVLPWLGFLDLSSLYPKITHKFALCLQKWSPKDPSAKLILKPWKLVLGATFDELVLINILPKLLFFMQDLKITEKCEPCKGLHHILDWVGLVPFDHLAKGFATIFYPKWRKTLEKMLSADTDLDTVACWVNHWRELLPPQLISLSI